MREYLDKNNEPTDYSKPYINTTNHIIAFFIGFVGGFGISFVYYANIIISIIGGIIVGIIYIPIYKKNIVKKRKGKLRVQFYELLESLSVSMRAGNQIFKALESARKDLALIYSEESDIIVEIDLILARFKNSVTISDSFTDLAKRSELEDIENFASSYSTIAGKSSRENEIVKDIQQIISDKMEMEMEMETLMTSSKNQLYIMFVMPPLLLLYMNYGTGGFLDAIYTTIPGRVVATIGLIIYLGAFFFGNKLLDVEM